MSVIVMKPAAFFMPEIIETGSATELFCDLALVKPFGETVRIKLCREVDPGGAQAEVIGMAVMTWSAWVRSHAINHLLLKNGANYGGH